MTADTDTARALEVLGKITPEGNAARQTLANDHGQIADAALKGEADT